MAWACRLVFQSSHWRRWQDPQADGSSDASSLENDLGALSQEMDKELGMMQKMNLRVHLMMCSGCRNFGKQVEFLRQSCRKFMQQDS